MSAASVAAIVAEMRQIVDERLIELADRLVAAGPKAAHVSASETHEISEAIGALPAVIDRLAALAPSAAVVDEDDSWRETERLALLGLWQVLEGFEVRVERSPLMPPATYLDLVTVSREFQPGDGERAAAIIRDYLAKPTRAALSAAALARVEGPVAEPVAEIGPVFTLLWAGCDTVASIVNKHGLKVGDKLYAAPPQAPAAQGDDRAEYDIACDVLSRLLEALHREHPDVPECDGDNVENDVALGLSSWISELKEAAQAASGLSDAEREALEYVEASNRAYPTSHLATVCAALRRLWQRQAVGDGVGPWFPISSAPKDGEHITLAWTDGGVAHGFWTDKGWADEEGLLCDEGHISHWCLRHPYLAAANPAAAKAERE